MFLKKKNLFLQGSALDETNLFLSTKTRLM